jgi:L-lactate utilization protein LutB
MTAESDAYAPEKQFNRRRALNSVEALKKNGFTAYFAETKEEAKKLAMSEIPEQATVGFGGSVTVRELGLPEALKDAGYTVFDHWDPSKTPAQKAEARDAQVTADVYVSSSNALTDTGALVNVDGSGNRVGSMIFGPKTSIVVCGYNKLVTGIPEAIERIHRYAAPVNYRRLNMNTPCQEGIDCSQCSPKSCRVTTIIEAPPGAKKKFVVIVVNEKLGF